MIKLIKSILHYCRDRFQTCPYKIVITSCLIAFCLLISAAAFAQDAGAGEVNSLFYRANSAYKDGNYDAAIADYELISGSGLESGNLYYNLGNCYFKKGELGRAVFNYELALFFSPSDSDLRSNYKYALSKHNLGPQLFGNGFKRFAARLFDGETIGFLTILLSAIYVIAVVILICGLFIAKISKMAKILLPALAVLFILSAVALIGKIDNFNKSGVVIAGETEVKFEPLEQGTTYFKLGAGSKVELVEKAQDFCKIKRPDNKVGWVRNTDVA
ncbi:MAG: tetratricopeptide repeat protein, partial [Candidatus Omnitrophota bacterium]|nr:tetratricopeptide repeat protein [Candidatus Omnitrophota bacterium]